MPPRLLPESQAWLSLKCMIIAAHTVRLLEASFLYRSPSPVIHQLRTETPCKQSPVASRWTDNDCSTKVINSRTRPGEGRQMRCGPPILRVTYLTYPF